MKLETKTDAITYKASFDTIHEQITYNRVRHAILCLVKEMVDLNLPKVDFILEKYKVSLFGKDKSISIEYPKGCNQILSIELKAVKLLETKFKKAI